MRRIAATGAALVLFVTLLFAVREYVIDDTFIHLQYAKHVRQGLGLVFNPGEPVAGTTSPLWSVYLGVVPTLGADLLTVSRLWSLLFGVAAVFAFAAVAFRLIGHRAEAIAAVLAWGVNAWMVRWTPSGMETSLAVFLVLLGLWIGLAGDGPLSASRRSFVLGLWALGALARPEISGLVLLALLFFFLISDGADEPRSLPGRLRYVAPAAVTVLAVWLPFALYAFLTYGTLLPGTLAAKSAGGVGADVALQRLLQSAQIVLAVAGMEVVLLLALLPRLRGLLTERAAALHAAALVWCLAVPLVFALRGVPVISRYLLPLLPLVVLYGWRALAGWRTGHVRLSSRLLFATALAVALGTNVYVFATRVVPHATAFAAGMQNTLIPWGKWLGENTPEDALIATPDIGAIGYYSDRRVLDLGGLVTPAIVPVMEEMPYDVMVHTFAFRRAGRPDYLVDRGRGAGRLREQSPLGPALTVLFTARTASLGVSIAGPVDYTLYRIDWEAADRILLPENLARGRPPQSQLQLSGLPFESRP